MKKTLLILPAVLVLALAGCSMPATAGGAAQTSAPSTTVTEDEATTPSEEPSEEDDGIAEFGQTFSYPDGLKVTVTDEGKFTPSESAFTSDSGPYRKYKITLTNGTDERFDPSLVDVALSSGGVDSDAVIDSARNVGIRPETKLRTGKSVSYLEAFHVEDDNDVTLDITPDYSHDTVTYAKG